MALTHLLLAFSLLSASAFFDTYAYGPNSNSYDSKKPEEEAGSYASQPKFTPQKPKLSGYQPKPSIEKPKLEGGSYEDKQKSPLERPQSFGYEPKLSIEKSKGEGESYGYQHKPVLEKSISFGYEQKPRIEKPKVGGGSYGYQPKPSLSKPKYSTYEPKPSIEKPKEAGGSYDYNPKPSIDIQKVQEKELYKKIGVQGIIKCQLGSTLIPLEGAVARVTCLATDKNGYELAPFSVLSKAADKKGYFFATLDLTVLLERKSKLSECKVYLETCPFQKCNIPTNVNKRITGSLLASPNHLLPHNKMKLFSLGPFIYGSVPKGGVPESGVSEGGY